MQNKELLIKGLLYRSVHRGCKETDILLGCFATDKINDFNDDELAKYGDLVLEDDAMIYDWILQKTPVPQKYKDLIANICKFHNL